ncbi:suppressor of lurcher protein 1 isoform X2 [Diorhabda carinulata]|uniref:suppressor of lurcher protein 1 isoform X2 n=1 Tax=Diorhabda carinulata TaxID=1163345 RepID=UPI0025A0A2E6|nr:suppressor of lurcher protein 1 isoform X2 [Diorhabda carinulata]
MNNSNAMKVPLYVLLIESTLIAAGVAVHPGCECIIFSKMYGKENGFFKSPDFPKPYSPNIDCLLYTFIGSTDEIVELSFSDFDLHKTQADCILGDYLKVFMHLEEVSVNEYTPWEILMCGGFADIPNTLYSSGSVLVLEFHSSSYTSNSTGFLGTFKFLDKRLFRTDGWKLPSTACDYEFYTSDHPQLYGKFYSPRFPSSYPKNIRCTYKFQGSCLNRADIIRVFDGSTSSDPSIILLCNEETQIEIFSTGPNLFIEFVANSDNPGRGFKGKFQFQTSDNSLDNRSTSQQGAHSQSIETEPNVRETRSNCDVNISSDTSRNGTIISPSYPSPYPAKTTCSYEFQGRGKERVQIVFHDFSLYLPNGNAKNCDNSDSLTVFIHIDGRIEKIDKFCGTTLPKPVMSNGPRLKLEFQSFYTSRYSRGFKSTYAFIENFGVKTGTQLSTYPCAFEFNSNESKEGYFHSPNYPGLYPRDTECHYFFNGNMSERVQLHFSYFDVEGVLPCEAVSASDYVEFSNFLTRDRKFSRYCGQLKEFDVESDKKFFRVTFRSNDRLDGTGFNATYRFVVGKKNPEKKTNANTNSSTWNKGVWFWILSSMFLSTKITT